LPTLTPADLERELPFPTGGTEKVGNFRQFSVGIPKKQLG